MKKIILVCLLAVTGHVFAQNITLGDLRYVLRTENAEQSTSTLSSKGFSRGTGTTLTEHTGLVSKESWRFTLETAEKKQVVTSLYLFQPEANGQPMVLLETTDITLFMKLMNQLLHEGFYYTETSTLYGQPQLHFSNNGEEILAMCANHENNKPFQLRFQSSGTNKWNETYTVPRAKQKKTTVPAKAVAPKHHRKVATKTKRSSA